MSSRAGSHAGRGFRYQDVVAAHLAVMGISGRYPYGMVIPEGRDDIELRGSEFRVLCQVKSRRDHMGPFNAKSIAGFIKKMWDSKARQPTDRFLLVLESDVAQRSSGETRLKDLSACPNLIAALKGQRSLSADVARTVVLVLPNPRADAVAELSARLGCAPQEAEVYFADLLGLVGQLADENGIREPAEYQGVGVSDVQQRFDALQPLLTSSVIEEALLTGLCAAVDFLTAHDDPIFYMGVDAQPAHVAAGLVVERPELRAEVLDGLQTRRNVLIHGPSGSGKSAILWDAAYASRHAVRWFQIRRPTPGALSLLVLLARSRRASLDAPVGFIIDDVGRGFGEGWTALTAEVRRTPGLLLLASVREEDRYPLVDKAHAAQIRVGTDTALAERIWRELGQRGQTNWQGWKEPWKLANGHLLEYTHVLTQGRRLSETLSEQVAVRLNDTCRHDELDVLRVVACANAAGCSAEMMRLPQVLGKSNTAVSMALSRLVDEHLVNGTADGRVVGLHELRSSELLRLTHEFPPPLLSSTAADAVQVVPANELARFLERTLSTHKGCDDAVLDALAQRIEAVPSASVFAAVMTGLDLAHAHRVVRDWLQTTEAGAVPKAQRALAGMMGLSNVELPDIGQDVQFGPACRRFGELRAASAPTSLSICCIARLGPTRLRRVVAAAVDVRELTLCVAALSGQALAEPDLDEFRRLNPPLLEADFDDVVALLEVACALDRSVALEWVNRVGQEAIFERFVESVSWVSTPSLVSNNGGIEVRANVWCVVGPTSADANKAVVRVCEILLAITPCADLVASNALGGDGQIQMMTADFPLVQKRISRSALPVPHIVNQNRGWMLALSTQLATDSSTAYLSRFLDSVRVVNRNLKLLLNSSFRRSPNVEALAALGRMNGASRALVPPPDMPSGDSRRWSRLQSLLFSCSADVIRRFFQLPEGAPAYIGWVDELLSSIKAAAAEESWDLLSLQSPTELVELTRILEGVRALAGEASVRHQSPFATHASAKAKKGSAFDKACHAAHQYHDSQLAALEANLRVAFCCEENGFDVFLLRDAAVPVLWPPADVVITVPAGAFPDLASWSTWRAAVDSGRRVCVLPVIQGYALTTFAIAGFDTPRPARDDAEKWCILAGTRPLPLVSVAAFTAITNPLSELDGIRTYWATKNARTPPEQHAYDDLLTALGQSRAAFHSLQVPDNVESDLNQFIDAVLAGELHLAAELAGLLRGESGVALEYLGQILQALTEVDLAGAETLEA